MAACDSVNFSATALVLPYQKLDDIVGSSRLQSFGKRKGGKKSLQLYLQSSFLPLVRFLFPNSVKFLDSFIDFANINGKRLLRLDNHFSPEAAPLTEHETVIVWVMALLAAYDRTPNWRALCTKNENTVTAQI